MSSVISRFFNRERSFKVKRPVICTVQDGSEPYTCKVILPDDKAMYLNIKFSEKGSDILRLVCIFSKILEINYFAFKYDYKSDGQKWLRMSKPLSSQIPSDVRRIHLHLRIKFYPANPDRMICTRSRHYLFLQVIQDIKDQNLVVANDYKYCMAAYLIQEKYRGIDVRRLDLSEFEKLLRNGPVDNEFREKAIKEHHKLLGMSALKAKSCFLEQASLQELYGSDCHFVLDDKNELVNLALLPVGIGIFKNGQNLEYIPWPRFIKIYSKNMQIFYKILVDSGEPKIRSFKCLKKEDCKELFIHSLEYLTFFNVVFRPRTQKSFTSILKRLFVRKDLLNQTLSSQKVNDRLSDSDSSEGYGYRGKTDIPNLYSADMPSSRCYQPSQRRYGNSRACHCSSDVDDYRPYRNFPRDPCHLRSNTGTASGEINSYRPLNRVPPPRLAQHFRYTDYHVPIHSGADDLPYIEVRTSSGIHPTKYTQKTREPRDHEDRPGSCYIDI